MKRAVIYYTHFASKIIGRELRRLCDEIPDSDIWVTGYCKTFSQIESLNTLATDQISVAAYDQARLLQLPYPKKIATMNWDDSRGNNDLALLCFFLDHPAYDEYCFIEYDVRCTGSWADIMSEVFVSKADMICPHIYLYSPEHAWWPFWQSMNGGDEEISPDHMARGFLPFCRISQRGLQAIDEAYRKGWVGHPEAVWPTVLRVAGLVVEELGGHGETTPNSRRGKFYYSAVLTENFMFTTFGIFPIYFDEELIAHNPIKNTTLWHPVKEFVSIKS